MLMDSAVTRIPSVPTSRASDAVKPRIARFEAA
jgi:hypothetical protein